MHTAFRNFLNFKYRTCLLDLFCIPDVFLEKNIFCTTPKTTLHCTAHYNVTTNCTIHYNVMKTQNLGKI